MITFSLSTLVVEAFGSLEDIAQLKALIVFPGLIILIPAMMATGISGRLLSVNRKGRLIDIKQKTYDACHDERHAYFSAFCIGIKLFS